MSAAAADFGDATAIEEGELRIRFSELADAGIAAVSYTHLTLPTIYSV